MINRYKCTARRCCKNTCIVEIDIGNEPESCPYPVWSKKKYPNWRLLKHSQKKSGRTIESKARDRD